MGWTETELLGCSVLFLEVITESLYTEFKRAEATAKQLEKHGKL